MLLLVQLHCQISKLKSKQRISLETLPHPSSTLKPHIHCSQWIFIWSRGLWISLGVTKLLFWFRWSQNPIKSWTIACISCLEQMLSNQFLNALINFKKKERDAIHAIISTYEKYGMNAFECAKRNCSVVEEWVGAVTDPRKSCVAKHRSAKRSCLWIAESRIHI